MTDAFLSLLFNDSMMESTFQQCDHSPGVSAVGDVAARLFKMDRIQAVYVSRHFPNMYLLILTFISPFLVLNLHNNHTVTIIS